MSQGDWTDLERRLAEACAQRGNVLIREDSDGTTPHYRIFKAHNNSVVVATGSLQSVIRTHGRVVDPTL
jgi:hypothetical protein